MMNIEHKSIEVYKESVIPAINFTVSENLEDDTILLKVEGIVLCRLETHCFYCRTARYQDKRLSYRNRGTINNTGE
jgi:hypothetical protein